MKSIRFGTLLSFLTVILTIWILLLPTLKYIIVPAESELVQDVLQTFTQSDYFMISKISLNGDWRYLAASFDQGNSELYYDKSYDDSSWKMLNVPFIFRATSSNSTLWLRRTFIVPIKLGGERFKIVFKGAWTKAEVWLNDRYLGGHLGYFSPFYFDVTDTLVPNAENVLTVFLSSPASDEESQKLLMGIYQNGSGLPGQGTGSTAGDLTVPIGLWNDVELATTGTTTIDLALVTGDLPSAGGTAIAHFRVLLRNLGMTKTTVDIAYSLKGQGYDEAPLLSHSTAELEPGEKKWVETELMVDDPHLWSTWDIGTPNLYQFTVGISRAGKYQGSINGTFGFTDFKGTLERTGSEFSINGKGLFLRGTTYVSDPYGFTSSADELSQDFDLIRSINVNFVRPIAHVEPLLFYELADQHGLAVEADLPLLGYIRSLDTDKDTVREAERQLVELVLLLYNSPSVIFWCVQTLPPWADPTAGDLFRSAANKMADASLSELLRTLDNRRSVLEGSGAEDEFLNFGWGSQSWVDYKTYATGFPIVLGSQSLPSKRSPFWDLLGERQLTPELIHSLERYGYATSLWETYIGDPHKYSTLSAYVNYSQAYQALILKTAIENARLLKGNLTGGVTAGLFRDFDPLVSASLVDYYGVPKTSLTALADAFRPTHVIIEWTGDYGINATAVNYDFGSVMKLNLWVVNDDPNALKDATVSWRLFDLTADSILQSGSINTTIPGSDTNALLVSSLSFGTPTFTDSDHLLQFEAILESKNGSVLDRNHFDFSVRAAANLDIRIVGSEMPRTSRFLLLLGNTYRFITVENGSSSIYIPSANGVEIWGPLLERDRIYVPIRSNLGKLTPGDKRTVLLSLIPGGIVQIPNWVTEMSQDGIPDIDFSFKAIGPSVYDAQPLPNGISMITNYTDASKPYLRLLNISAGSVIIPAYVPTSILAKVRFGSDAFYYSIGNASVLLLIGPGQRMNATSLASFLVARNEELLWQTVKEARNVVDKQSSEGFYLGLESQRIEEIDRALMQFNSTDNPAIAAEAQKRAYLMSLNVIGAINAIYKDATTSQLAVFILVILVSVSVAGTLFEKVDQEILFLVAGFIVIMSLVYQTYPGFAEFSMGEVLIGSYLFFLASVLLFLVPRLIGDMKSEGGISLAPAIMLAISYSSGNMKKRKTRTMLSLISLATFILGLSTFTAMKTTLTASQFVINSQWPNQNPSLLLVSKPTGFFTQTEFDFISSQVGVTGTYPRAESPPSQGDIGQVGTSRIDAVKGISRGDPNFGVVSASTQPTSAVELLFTEGNSVIISRNLAQSQKLDIGMSFVINNVKLRIVGIFDAARLRNLKDPDGTDWLPLLVPPDPSQPPISVEPEYLLITSDVTALKLGAKVSKLYCIVDRDSILNVGERMSLLANFYALALPSGENLRFFFRGIVNELTGMSAIVPLAIIVLNILVVLLSSVRERRSEIFTFSAVGLNPTHIFLLHVAEGAVLGLIGGGIGYLFSFIAFRLMSMTSIMIPVDVKTSTGDMLFIVGVSVLVSTIGAAIPAFTASRIATPSLRMKWKLEEHVRVGNEWIVPIPARIPQEKVDLLVDYLAERLPLSVSELEIIIGGVSRTSSLDENGRPVHLIKFRYSRSGNRAFNSQNVIEVKKEGGLGYEISLRVNPESIYSKMAEMQVHEIASHIRKLVFEWTASKARVAAPLGTSIESLLSLVRVYHPQLLIVYSRTDVGNKMKELRKRLWREGVWPPAIEVRKISIETPQYTISRLTQELRDIDTICVDSDDGAVSSAITLASIVLKKNVAIWVGDRYTEIQAEKLLIPSEQSRRGENIKQ